MKQGRRTHHGVQTSFPFVSISEKGRKGIISLNKEKFVHYLLKSIEIEFAEAEKLYKEIEEELSHFHGANRLEFLEKILSSKIEPYSAKKSEPKSKIKLTDNARVVLRKRYLLRKPNSVLETPEELFRRVAHAIAEPDRLYGNLESKGKVEEKFYTLLSSLEFLPNSPTLMNAGKPGGQLAACFVLPIEDSVDSIFETLKQTAVIQKSGGGTGFNFSKLRPKNSYIQTTQGLSSGPISFISIFNSVTDTIKQGGTRRGANMAILNVDHPDIIEFIHCKESGGLVNFNISVAVTDAFMKAAKKNEKYPLIYPQSGSVAGELNAADVLNQIVEAAWKTGDPGLVFMDRMNEFNPTPHIGKFESTNPCGEQILLPYEACNLGSINLTAILKDGEIDWEKLSQVTKTAVHFLDNVIDANAYPIPQIEAITKANRKIGLGVMGLADLFAKKKIPYNSQQALDLADKLMSFIRENAMEASEELAQKRGAFPNFKGSIHDKPGRKPLRNATVTTIAPTGTLSLIAGCSSGIEPIFARSYIKEVLEGEKLPEVHPEGIPTAHEISAEWHVRMQALFQKYSDSAVSKTVNLAHTATVEDVHQAYSLAYELGCKGITVFRDRSKETQVLNIPPKDIADLICPECKTLFKHEEACTYCPSCGYMKCY